MRPFLALVFVAACEMTTDPADDAPTGDTDPTDATETDVVPTDSPIGPTDATDATDVTDTGPPSGPTTLKGRVRDASGAALTESAVLVFYCRTTVCLSPSSFTGGDYSFDDVVPGSGSLEIKPIGPSPTLATAFVPFTMPDGKTVTIDVTVPALGAAVTIPETSAALMPIPSLELTVGTSDLEPPSPFDPAPTTLAAADATEILPRRQGLPGTVVKAWYLSPYEYAASGGLPVRVRDVDASFPSGSLDLYVGSYDDREWQRVGSLTATSDGWHTVDGTLPRTSTLVVVAP